MKILKQLCLIVIVFTIMAFNTIGENDSKHKTIVYLIGDSTMADYANNYEPGKDYMKIRFPVTGWGQVFQQFLVKDSLQKVNKLIKNKVLLWKIMPEEVAVHELFFRKEDGVPYLKNLKKTIWC